MGTSNLYKGPKSSVLLPSDYTDGQEDTSNTDNSNSESPIEDSTIDDELDDAAKAKEPEKVQSWGSARSAMTRSASNNSGSNGIRKAVREYTKALGGHRNASRQASSARRVTASVISLFSGSSSEVKAKVKALGITFEGKSTTDVLLDIRDVLAPVPDQLEEGYVNKALNDTMSDILADAEFQVEDIDELFNAKLLEKMVCGFIKGYIYNKMIAQSTLGVLMKQDSVSNIARFEKELKNFIDGVVQATVPPMLHSGMEQKEISVLVNDLYDVTYQSMEA